MKREDFNRFYFNSVYSAGYDCAEKMGVKLAREIRDSEKFTRESAAFQDGFMKFLETHI